MATFDVEIESKTALRINGKLIDITLIEHWARGQGGAKFHGIRTALTILTVFINKRLKAEDDSIEPHVVERVLEALRRLAEYGYYLPPEVFGAGASNE